MHTYITKLATKLMGVVAQVMEGGAAFNDGRISVGDRLVAVRHLPNTGNHTYTHSRSHTVINWGIDMMLN